MFVVQNMQSFIVKVPVRVRNPDQHQNTQEPHATAGVVPIVLGPSPAQEEDDTNFLDLTAVPERDDAGIRMMISSYARNLR